MATSVNKHINIWVNGTQVENNMKSIRSAMSKLYNEIAKTTNGTKEWAEKVEKLKKLRTISEENRKAIYDTNKEMNKTGGIIDKIKEKSNSLQGVFQAIFFGKKFYNWIVSTSQEYVDAYARIDDAMTSVQKYTGLAREEVEELNEDLKKMDTRTSVEELNRLAGEAGRLGITGKKDILEFVEAADIINVALGEDLGEDAVKQIGKMAEMFGDSDKLGLRGAMLATGSAINKLGASSSASEQFLMDFTARLAGTGNQAGITQANIMGYAAVLDQNMQQVEMSATATQKLLLDMFVEPEKYAKLAGLSVKDFANLLKTDANEALLTFIETSSAS